MGGPPNPPYECVCVCVCVCVGGGQPPLVLSSFVSSALGEHQWCSMPIPLSKSRRRPCHKIDFVKSRNIHKHACFHSYRREKLIREIKLCRLARAFAARIMAHKSPLDPAHEIKVLRMLRLCKCADSPAHSLPRGGGGGGYSDIFIHT